MGKPSTPRRRGWWTGVLPLAALAAALAGAPGPGEGPGPPGGAAGAAAETARVIEVIDGDTIAVELAGGREESVRYIGVDTPESTSGRPLECFGHEAAHRNERLVGGEVVGLRYGPERRDAYGRLLAYVYARGRLVNARLVADGFARTLTIAPNDARAPMLRRLEAAAGRAGIGLWDACGARSASPFANLSGP